MKNKIRSLESLKAEKKKLRMEMELSKREFAHSLGTSRANLKSFLFQNVAIPAGVAGLGVAGIKTFFNSYKDNKNEPVRYAQQSDKSPGLLTYLPLIISAFQAYFVKNTMDENSN